MKILQQQVSKFAEVNEKFVGDCAELNSKIDILKNLFCQSNHWVYRAQWCDEGYVGASGGALQR